MESKPYLHGGCGRIILPGPKPAHHNLIDSAVYDYPLFLNVDRNAEPGVDEIVDLFQVPFPWADNSFDGALFAHLCEHLPHEIKIAPFGVGVWTDRAAYDQRVAELSACQDFWYAWWAEVHRVLTPGAVAHILSPYGWSQGAITDPSHCRMITEHTFTHSLQPDPNSPFRYETAGLNLRLVEPCRFGITPMFAHLIDRPELLQQALMTQLNVAYEIAACLEAVK